MNGKGTDTFKTAIQNYLEYRAATDELFAPLFANPNKSIDECCKYIICKVHKSGMNGFDRKLMPQIRQLSDTLLSKEEETFPRQHQQLFV